MEVLRPGLPRAFSRSSACHELVRTSVIALGAALTCLASVLSVGAQESVKIVSSLPRTGSANGQSTSIVNGIRLAIEDYRASLPQFTLSHEDLDDASPERGAWDPVLEAANADKAIRDPEVLAYIGPFNSGAAKISMPRLNQAGVPVLNGFATWPGLTKPGLGEPNEPVIYRPSGAVTFFRVVPADDIQGRVAAKWTKDLGAQKAFVIHDRELYGKGIAEIYRKSAFTYGITVLGFEGIDIKASNYRSLAIKIKQQNPDLIFFGGTTQSNAGQLVKDLRSVGLKSKLMVPDGCFEKAFIESAGRANVEGLTYVTFGGVPATNLVGKGKEFYERYKKTYNQEPESYAAYGYEAASVILEALKKTGKKDRAALIETLRQVRDFPGVLGTWSFNANGDTTLTTMSGNIVRGDTFEFSTSLAAE